MHSASSLSCTLQIDDASSLKISLSAGVLSHKAAFVQFLQLQESGVRQRVNHEDVQSWMESVPNLCKPVQDESNLNHTRKTDTFYSLCRHYVGTCILCVVTHGTRTVICEVLLEIGHFTSFILDLVRWPQFYSPPPRVWKRLGPKPLHGPHLTWTN